MLILEHSLTVRYLKEEERVKAFTLRPWKTFLLYSTSGYFLIYQCRVNVLGEIILKATVERCIPIYADSSTTTFSFFGVFSISVGLHFT